ncbi:MAG: hypothetical protein U9R25_00755 [Chloroflexota bacterium]|nr:hypothetical protein [Chloroflexota bacterium]
MAELSNLKMRSELYYYVANVTAVYDGDTVTVDLDLGLGVWRKNQKIRLWKINAPEVRGPERTEGLVVRDYVRGLVHGKTLLLRTILDKRGADKTGKFGRLLGEILVDTGDDESLNVNQHLLDEGMVLPMTEGGAAAAAPGLTRAPEAIACPYCGEIRAVDPATRLVEVCPNCLDGPYEY